MDSNALPLPLVDDCLFIDNSSMEVFTTCARAAQYYIIRKRELNRPRSALEFGKIIHHILEARYRLGTSQIDQPVLDAMHTKLNAGFQTYVPDLEDFRNYSTGVGFIEEYAKVYPFEEFTICQTDKSCIELPFALPIGTIEINDTIWVREPDGLIRQRYVGTIQIVWKGKIDMIVRQPSTAPFVFDHKTTSMMGPSFFGEFELSHQMHGYVWAANKLLGEPVAGVIINGLGIRKPTRTGKAFEFIRHQVHVYPQLLEEWQQDTIHIVSDFVAMAIRGYMPKHTKWCHGKYGACQFKSVCSLPDPSHRDLLLETNEYKAVTWDPLKE